MGREGVHSRNLCLSNAILHVEFVTNFCENGNITQNFELNIRYIKTSIDAHPFRCLSIIRCMYVCIKDVEKIYYLFARDVPQF